MDQNVTSMLTAHQPNHSCHMKAQQELWHSGSAGIHLWVYWQGKTELVIKSCQILSVEALGLSDQLHSKLLAKEAKLAMTFWLNLSLVARSPAQGAVTPLSPKHDCWRTEAAAAVAQQPLPNRKSCTEAVIRGWSRHTKQRLRWWLLNQISVDIYRSHPQQTKLFGVMSFLLKLSSCSLQFPHVSATNIKQDLVPGKHTAWHKLNTWGFTHLVKYLGLVGEGWVSMRLRQDEHQDIGHETAEYFTF